MKYLYSAFLITAISLNAFAQSTLTYKDVAGIFYKRCTSCHHVNGGAPFSMMNYSETAPYAASVKNALLTGKMPPWSPDTNYTRFLHERIITSSEKDAIINWINTGYAKGDTTLTPAPPVYTSKYKLRGKPDLIIKVPSFPSNGAANDAYNCFSLPSGLTQDRIVRAFEVVPSNPSIVHHVVIKVDTTGTIASNTSGGCFSQPGQFDLDVYAPGGAPTVFPGKAPLKMGIRLKKGSNIILQVHYPQGTSGLIDSTEMRIYFYPVNETGIRPVFVNTLLQNWLMSIPPNTVTPFTAQYPASGGIPFSVSVFGAFPHSHLVCKSMTNYADNGTTTIPLIRINNWDFEWQGFYTYPKMVKIPAGYTLRSTHVFDNTVNNPNNPNSPPQTVTAGEGTKDEMLFDSFQWLVYQPGDELINIGDLLANDTLLTPVNELPAVINIRSAVYPNPFSEETNIWVDGIDFNSQKPQLKVTDMLGNEVYSKRLNSERETLTLKQPAGVYFYTIRTGNSQTSGKIVVMPK